MQAEEDKKFKEHKLARCSQFDIILSRAWCHGCKHKCLPIAFPTRDQFQREDVMSFHFSGPLHISTSLQGFMRTTNGG
ncbi:Uncharacterized protein HZ326_27354 [Fusarium oxysporum f. sp. albedinis]|nr:Uncharacterized protein HZ326_27354 [Fusarium oxysporum f. sp. albedinis]